MDVDDLGLVGAEPEAQRAFEDVGDLLVLVVMERDDLVRAVFLGGEGG